MSNTPVDNGRRRFLTAATSVVGGVGVVAAAVPFIASWNPSARAKSAGAPVEVDISKLEAGAMIRIEWQGKPVWVIKRTPETVAKLSEIDGQLRDPNSEEDQQPEFAKNKHRALREDVFIAVGICTHLGCSPTYRPNDFSEVVEGIPSGFYCPCHGSKFDMAGRVFKSVPAPTNLMIPPYKFLNDNTVLVGEA